MQKKDLLDILFQIDGMPEHKKLERMSVPKLTKLYTDSGVEFVWQITSHQQYVEGGETVALWPSRFEQHAIAHLASLEDRKSHGTDYYYMYPKVLEAPKQ